MFSARKMEKHRLYIFIDMKEDFIMKHFIASQVGRTFGTCLNILLINKSMFRETERGFCGKSYSSYNRNALCGLFRTRRKNNY